MAYTPRGPATGGPAGRGVGAERIEGRAGPPARAGRSAGPGSSVPYPPPAYPSPTPAVVGSSGGVRLSPARRRRELPYLVLGVALVVVGALGAMVLASRSGQRVEALVVVGDVAVGQPLTATDLRVEPVLAGSTVPVVTQGDAASMVGRVAAVPLRAGHLLAPDDVGPLAWPPAGQVLLAAAVTPGSYPPELAAGMHVLIVTGPSDAAPVPSAGGDGPVVADGLFGAPDAVVAGVRANPAGTGGVVVSLLLSQTAAGQATTIPSSRLRLVVVPAPVTAPTPAAASSAAAAAPGGGG